ncbi:hypothetical protein S40293_11113 [Stachybotrys chartarum IBT 40293]|nr:hypothetical protein S40293_11113 [Stachybotrys chartarum IBT 40293]
MKDILAASWVRGWARWPPQSADANVPICPTRSKGHRGTSGTCLILRPRKAPTCMQLRFSTPDPGCLVQASAATPHDGNPSFLLLLSRTCFWAKAESHNVIAPIKNNGIVITRITVLEQTKSGNKLAALQHKLFSSRSACLETLCTVKATFSFSASPRQAHVACTSFDDSLSNKLQDLAQHNHLPWQTLKSRAMSEMGNEHEIDAALESYKDSISCFCISPDPSPPS